MHTENNLRETPPARNDTAPPARNDASDLHTIASELAALAQRLAIYAGATISSTSSEWQHARTICLMTAESCNVSLSELMGRRKHARVAWPRMLAMTFVSALTSLHASEVGLYFGRDRAMLFHARRAVAARLQTEPLLGAAVEKLRAQIAAKISAT